MVGGFELLIVVDAKGKTVFEVGIDLIPSGEIQTLESAGSLHTLLQTASCGGTNRQIPTTSGTAVSDFHPFRFARSLEPFGMSAVTPIADKMLQCRECPLCAKSRLMHRSKQPLYSITSSTRTRCVR